MQKPPQAFKTCLFFADFDQGNDYLIDTIEREGQWWLVGSWHRGRSGERAGPATLVLLSILAHDEVADPRFRFVLRNPIPKAVLDGAALDGYVVAMPPALDDTPEPGSTTRH